MVLVIKANATVEEIKKAEKQIKWKSKSSFNAKKFNGFIKFADDGLTIQKKLRDEWEGNIG